MTPCDHPDCANEARWLAYGAYGVDNEPVHPHVAHYPAPMIKACGLHLVPELNIDMDHAGSTNLWVVKPI